MQIPQSAQTPPADPSAKRTDVSRYRTSEIDLEGLVARQLPRDPDQSGPVTDLRQIAVGGLAPWQMRNVQAYVDLYLRSTIRVEALAGLCNLTSGPSRQALARRRTNTSPAGAWKWPVG
jgi:AraC family transcriptional regulator